MSPHPCQPTELEIACGLVLGAGEPAPPSLEVSRRDPLTALEDAIRPALERPPCGVTFSGGRDSSMVLAVASRLARREGLPLPVPVTVRFRHAPGTGEASWQDAVARSLRLADWVRLEVGDELDFVGPVATRILRRHGVVFPAHASLLALQLEALRGGALLTGFGGDQVFSHWVGTRIEDALPPVVGRLGRDLLVGAYGAAPRALRRRLVAPGAPSRPWLRRPVQEALRARWLAAEASAPASYARFLRMLGSRRSVAAVRWTSSLLGDEVGALVTHPFYDPGFLAALGRSRPPAGGRTAAMRALVAGAVPTEVQQVLGRDDKAVFLLSYYGTASRAFARAWDGAGISDELVDPEALRRAWLARLPHGAAGLALQAAWLAAERQEVEAPGRGEGATRAP